MSRRAFTLSDVPGGDLELIRRLALRDQQHRQRALGIGPKRLTLWQRIKARLFR